MKRRVKKRVNNRLLILSGCLCCALYMAVWCPRTGLTVYAKELAARGNLLYQDEDGKAGIYESDFLILDEKMSVDSTEAFGPDYYTHTHLWEYRDVNERTHTRHCAICGDEYDLVQNHKAESEEKCTIFAAEREVPGRRFICACGYRWEREAAHELTFDMVDETCHRSRCLLDGTAYCPGYEPVEEEHFAYYHTWDETGDFCIKTCMDCGCQIREESAPRPEKQMEVTESSNEEPETSNEEPETAEEAEEESKSPGSGEAAEPAEEKPEFPEPGETAEPAEEKPEFTEPGETAEPAEDEKKPPESVSGNDCAGKETQPVTEETEKKPANEKGENL